jgi:hypothetical protein
MQIETGVKSEDWLPGLLARTQCAEIKGDRNVEFKCLT